jgi:release factor glutamine methyltransferase
MNLKLQPPKQYQQGWSEFYKLKFKLTPDVLIPRPETELLVDQVIEFGKELWRLHESGVDSTKNPSFVSIVDVGTGSGAISVSIAKNIPFAKIIAVDISNEALAIAKQNSKLHHTDDQILFIQNDLISGFDKPADIIVANLPYIPTARLLHIDPMVSEFEPKLALDGGKDGFDHYRKLFTQIRDQKIPPNLLICEIDEEQRETAALEAKRYFPKGFVEIKKDLAKKDRFLEVRF